jgi:hypothetical protein
VNSEDGTRDRERESKVTALELVHHSFDTVARV